VRVPTKKLKLSGRSSPYSNPIEQTGFPFLYQGMPTVVEELDEDTGKQRERKLSDEEVFELRRAAAEVLAGMDLDEKQVCVRDRNKKRFPLIMVSVQ
jgi:hypothetical protein